MGFASFDGALHWDGGEPTLILLVPRDGSGAPRFIETDAFFQFHFANGFEEDGALVLDLGALSRLPHDRPGAARLLDVGMAGRGHGDLTRLRDRPRRPARSTAGPCDSGSANEFPRINPAYVGQAPPLCLHRLQPRRPRAQGLQQQVARVDLESGAVTRHDFGPDGYPGEPLFIATRPGGAEDDRRDR